MKIKLHFSDFYPGFDPKSNFFFDLLSTKYDIELTQKADFLIYSNFGSEHEKFKGTKIFYTGENLRAKFDQCDFAFTFDYLDNENHYRLPLYALYDGFYDITSSKINKVYDRIHKSGFCNFVYSNPDAPVRNEFYERLSKYKKVDSGGRHNNNIGGPVDDKLAFIKNYKFTIAFENASYPGYTTEKLMQPLMANTVPIYWGNPLAYKDFNKDSFINFHDYDSVDQLIDKIKEIDQNDELYLSYLNAPKMKNNKFNEFVDKENVLRQFEKIFQSKPINKGGLLNWLKR